MKDKKSKGNSVLTKTLILTAALILVGIFGVADYMLEPYLSFVILYLIPISIAIWYVNRAAGFFILLVCAAAWMADDVLSSTCYTDPVVPYWDLGLKFVLCVAFVHVLSLLKNALGREQQLSRMDPLTHAANRRYFSEIADLEIKRSQRYKRPVSLAYIDIDNFKHINDTRGHKEGDRLLQVAAYSLQKSIRISDMVARVGGDEFVVLLGETGYDSAETAVNRLRNELLSVIQENKWPVTASIGIATCNNSECNFDQLLTRADDLMYSAKKEGKNKVKHEEL